MATRTLLLVLALWAGACSSTRLDLAAWRAEVPPRPEGLRGAPEEDLARIDALRAAFQLTDARTLALQVAAERPEDARARLAASRAESDGVVLFADRERAVRDHAAASARDHAEAAVALGLATPEARAQLAWALGTTTHLQPMMARSGHARRVIEVAEGVLANAPDEPTAATTLALVHLRLETLPWIARVFAWSRPDSSLADAERFARTAVAAEPSLEHHLVLAKVLVAAGRKEEARAALGAALEAPPRFPRDSAVAPAARAYLESL
jgi:tetratricopeptide (TPR) repeat protein